MLIAARPGGEARGEARGGARGEGRGEGRGDSRADGDVRGDVRGRLSGRMVAGVPRSESGARKARDERTSSSISLPTARRMAFAAESVRAWDPAAGSSSGDGEPLSNLPMACG